VFVWLVCMHVSFKVYKNKSGFEKARNFFQNECEILYKKFSHPTNTNCSFCLKVCKIEVNSILSFKHCVAFVSLIILRALVTCQDSVRLTIIYNYHWLTLLGLVFQSMISDVNPGFINPVLFSLINPVLSVLSIYNFGQFQS